MITYKVGSLFDSNCQTLVNTVNCKGVMGKGLALEFKKRFPEMFTKYKDTCLYSKTQLKHGGDLWLFTYEALAQLTLWDTDGHLNKGRQSRILCFATKEKWRNPSKLEWIERGLQNVKYFVSTYGIRDIAFPKLGCSNGGLDWNEVRPLMEKYLGELDIPVEIWVDNKSEIPETYHPATKKKMVGFVKFPTDSNI